MSFLNKGVLVRSKQIVDPEPVPMLDQVLSLLPSFSATMENIPQLRAFQKETARLQQSLVPAFLTITVTEGSLPGLQGPDVRVLVYVPRNVPTPMPALLWIHGGGIFPGAPKVKMPRSKRSFRRLAALPFPSITAWLLRPRIPARSRTATTP